MVFRWHVSYLWRFYQNTNNSNTQFWISQCEMVKCWRHINTSCYHSVGHKPGILWKNMISEIPTLWATSPHIFWHFLTVGSFPVRLPGRRPANGLTIKRWSLPNFHSGPLTLSICTVDWGRKLWGALHCPRAETISLFLLTTEPLLLFSRFYLHFLHSFGSHISTKVFRTSNCSTINNSIKIYYHKNIILNMKHIWSIFVC